MIFFVLTSVAAPSLRAQSTPDRLIGQSLGPGGCYNFSLTNTNGNQQPIDGVHLRILAPGTLWHLRVKAPPAWTVAMPSPDVLRFHTDTAVVKPAMRQLFTGICLDPVCDQPASIPVYWETLNGTAVISADTLLLECLPLDRADTITLRDSAGVLLITVMNRNSGGFQTDAFTIESLTPGIAIAAWSVNGWGTAGSTDTIARFTAGGTLLSSGETLPGFAIDPDIPVSAVPPFRFRWTTSFDQRGISTGEFSYDGPPQGDSIRWYGSGPTPDGATNLQPFTLRNLHRPAGAIDRIRFEILTPGIRVSAPGSGPWTHTIESQTAVRFDAVTPLPTGDSLVGMQLAMVNPGVFDQVRLRWQTFLNGTAVFSDTIMLACPPTVFTASDTMLLAMGDSCAATVLLVNRHAPFTTSTHVAAEILAGGEDFVSVTAPAGWRLDSLTLDGAYFRHAASGLSSGDTTEAFILNFTEHEAGRPFPLRLRSWYNQRVVGEDVQIVACEAPPGNCDSIGVHVLDSRASLFSVYNTHQPASTITAVAVSAPARDVTIGVISLPDGWMVDSAATDYLRATTTAGLPSGEPNPADFALRFSRNTRSDVSLRWCTIDSAGVICCQTLPLQLPAWRDCDSLEVTPIPGDCGADLRLHNIHGGGATIVALGIHVRTPGRTIDTAFARPGWNVERHGADRIAFIPDGHDGLNPGTALVGISVRFGPAGASGDVEFEWTTYNRFSGICGNLATVSCTPASLDCDSVAVTADTTAPCCFDLSVTNLRAADVLVDSVALRVLTPDVLLYQSTVTAPEGWVFSGGETAVEWSTASDPIPFGALRTGFGVCFDNDATGNAPFEVEVRRVDSDGRACLDTVLLQCGQTLRVTDAPYPTRAALSANYPNPFAGVTTLVYDIPRGQRVMLEVLDATGRVVFVAVDGHREAGGHVLRFDASSLPSGMYFARLRSGQDVIIRAMMHLRR
ncbi:MAG: T9SS type A sorting domain-containing protein [Bacteroidota bacterium]|nr:T9SS type A sorting domain-containing protein [Bacteroidota bacterium]